MAEETTKRDFHNNNNFNNYSNYNYVGPSFSTLQSRYKSHKGFFRLILDSIKYGKLKKRIWK